LIDLTVSRRYARALMMLGQDDGKYKEYGDELKTFTQLLEREPELKDALLNPVHSMEERKKLLLHIADLLKLSPGDTQTEALLEHALEMREVDAVDDMLGHGPALQPV